MWWCTRLEPLTVAHTSACQQPSIVQKISIIIPTLNEASVIKPTLSSLQPLRKRGHELIVVDGGSTDRTADIAVTSADQIFTTAKGRAHQMNYGAAQAEGEILLFLHADTTLPENADELILEALTNPKTSWGRFDIQFTGSHWLFRLIAYCMNHRSRITAICTGDQAIFVTQTLFNSVSGFPAIELMEDIALCQKLRQRHAPARITDTVITASRRWEEYGIIRTIARMWLLRMAYFIGINPAHLAKYYH